jgi:hypothetical protein
MKKIILPIVTFIIAMVFSFKSNSFATDRFDKLISSLNENTENYVSVNFGELNLGELHNQTVIALYDNVDFTNIASVHPNIEQNFHALDYDPSALNITRTEFDNDAISFCNELKLYNYDMTNWTSSSIQSSDAYPYLEQIISEVKTMTTLLSLNNSLDGVRNSAQGALSGEQLDIVIGAILIAKSSAYLWSPTNDGGYGLFDQKFDGIIENFGTSDITTKKKKAILAAIVGDISASGFYFTRLGILGAVGVVPGGNLAILGGWAAYAGIGSAKGAWEAVVNP